MKSKLAFVSVFLLGLNGTIYAATPSTQKWLVNAIGRPSALKIYGKGFALTEV